MVPARICGYLGGRGDGALRGTGRLGDPGGGVGGVKRAVDGELERVETGEGN